MSDQGAPDAGHDRAVDETADVAVPVDPAADVVDAELSAAVEDDEAWEPLGGAELAGAVEAVLFVVDSPLEPATIAAALRVPVPEVAAAVAALRAGYDERRAGIELREVAGGIRLYTRSDFAPQVEAFLRDGTRSRLSQAALETLAVIAYRQPVTRARVSAIRGVAVDGVMRTLLSRGLIVEVGTVPETGAGLFATSELFLERMGLQSVDELPSLAPLLPDLEGLETDELST